MKIYTIKEGSYLRSLEQIPDFVARNVTLDGYFTLLAVEEGSEEDEFMGVAQFYVDMTLKGLYYAELCYIYVADKYRYREAGLRLIGTIIQILSSEDVGIMITDIPKNDEGEVLSDLTEGEIQGFLKECGFIPASDGTDSHAQYFMLTRR